VVTRRQWLGAAAGAVAARIARGAETRKTTARVGFLAANTPEVARAPIAAFQRALSERGWVEGRNLSFEIRYGQGEADRLPGLAAELVRLRVDVIVTGSSSATRAAKDATRSIPIVMGASADALEEGFVTNLARPGGNITGMTFRAGPEVASKQLELLRSVAGRMDRVAVLANPANASHRTLVKALEVAARTLGAELRVVDAQRPREFTDAFAAIAKARVGGLLVLTDSMFFGQRRSIVEMAAKAALPAMYSQREFAIAGGLASYGPSLSGMLQLAALQVDKILNGASPGDIPVEQAATFELVINARTARTLGLAVPQSVLLRADEIVE